jgi:hypothetical protein
VTRRRKDSGKDNGNRGALVLDMLLISACIALIGAAQLGIFSWSSVAAADGEGGSTIPIPPPKRPTPSTPTQTPPATAVTHGGLVRLVLTNLSLSPTTIVQTTAGSLIPLTGAGVRVEDGPDGSQRVVFPFVLEPGQEIGSFHDPESGLAWLTASTSAEDGVLYIPLAGGQVPGGLTIELGILQGAGQEAWAPVLRAALRIGPVELGNAGLQGGAVLLSANLRRLPSEIALDVQGVALDSELVSALNEAGGALNMGITSIAYVVEIETGLTDEIPTAVMEMWVDKEWARGWTPDKISIVRISAEGSGRILKTVPVGEDDLGRSRFITQLAGGFSTFALVALGDLTSAESKAGLSWAQWLGIALGAVALAGMAAGTFLLLGQGRRG